MCQSYVNLRNQFIRNNYQIIILIKSIRSGRAQFYVCRRRLDCRSQNSTRKLRVILPTFPALYSFYDSSPSRFLCPSASRRNFPTAGFIFHPPFFRSPFDKPKENEFRSVGKDVGEGDGEPLNILSFDKKSCERDATFICQ